MVRFTNCIKIEREKDDWLMTDFDATVGINAFAIRRIEIGAQEFCKTKLQKCSEHFKLLCLKSNVFFCDVFFCTEVYLKYCFGNIFSVFENTVELIKDKSSNQEKQFK